MRDLMMKWKSKIGIVSGVICSTEFESEEWERFHFFQFRLRLRHSWSSKKLGCQSQKQKRKNQPIAESNIVIGLFFCFCLRLRQCSFHLVVSNRDISRISVLLPTLSVGFSLDGIALPFWLRLRGFIKFLCRRSVGVFSWAFLVFLMKESKKRRWKQPGKLMAKSRSQLVNLPGAWPLMNPLTTPSLTKTSLYSVLKEAKKWIVSNQWVVMKHRFYFFFEICSLTLWETFKV